jgi:hypothetical protein
MSILAQKSSITFWPQPVVPSHVSWLCSKSAWVGVGLLSQSDSIESPGVAHLSIFFFFKASYKILVFRTREPYQCRLCKVAQDQKDVNGKTDKNLKRSPPCPSLRIGPKQILGLVSNKVPG